MPTNIEIKAIARNIVRQRALAEELSDIPAQVITQADIFFETKNDRLKLRIFDDAHGELIAYRRDHSEKPRASDYLITMTNEPRMLQRILSSTLAVVGEVRKTRTLFLVGRTRIHIDEVEELGAFIELEVVLRENETHDMGISTAYDLMQQLEIGKSDLLAKAYIDLILERSNRK